MSVNLKWYYPLPVIHFPRVQQSRKFFKKDLKTVKCKSKIIKETGNAKVKFGCIVLQQSSCCRQIFSHSAHEKVLKFFSACRFTD